MAIDVHAAALAAIKQIDDLARDRYIRYHHPIKIHRAQQAAQTLKEAIEPPLQTHAEGCWAWGPRHYLCAIEEIKRLQDDVDRLSA